MKDLSEKRKLNTLNLVETGISKKNGTNDANMRPYGPDVIKLKLGSAASQLKKKYQYVFVEQEKDNIKKYRA